MDHEKNDPELRHVDAADKGSDSHDDDDHGFTLKEQRKIIGRIDRRLVVTVGAMYCVSLMDRTNMSAANIAGMSQELILTGFRYNIANLVFFIPYIIFQPPSTILIRKVGPRIHLALITLLWGAVMIGMGFSDNWETLAALRVLLGVLEAGFFPSCVFLLSTWYTRYDVGKRYSVFYILGCVASACAGILAYGLMQLHGREGLTGWRWIFIIEGALTVFLGMVGYWALVDFPDKAHKSWKFISQREAQFIIDRVNHDRGDAKTEPFSAVKFFKAGLDPKIWGYAMIFFNTTTISYALAYFLPIILKENMGFSIAASQCLVAPPYVFGAFIMFGTGWAGDKYKVRGPIILFNMLLCLIGLPIMGWHKSAGVRYFAIFLVTAGANANVPAVMSYQANNIRGQWKRAFCSATLVGFGGIGGIAGSLVFRLQDAPDYHPGVWACIACCLLTTCIVGLLTLNSLRMNRKADREGIELEHDGDDIQRGFRYTY